MFADLVCCCSLNTTIEVIKKPVGLVLNSYNGGRGKHFLYGRMQDYYNFSICDGNNFVNSEGYVRVINPYNRTYYSLVKGSPFEIYCEDRGVRIPEEDLYFPGMECIEGNYTISWAFTNIIKNRDIYLDAVVNYDGENWTIVRQNSRVDDWERPRRRIVKHELGFY